MHLGRDQRIWAPVHFQRVKKLLFLSSPLIRRRITNSQTSFPEWYRTFSAYSSLEYLTLIVFCDQIFLYNGHKTVHGLAFWDHTQSLSRYTCSFKPHLCSVSSPYCKYPWLCEASLLQQQLRSVLILWYSDRKLLGRQKLESLYRNAKKLWILQSCKCKSSGAPWRQV